MKRNMDLVREILLTIEQHESGSAPQDFTVEGFTREEVGFHVMIMAEAGLVDAFDVRTQHDPSPIWHPRAITWKGYEFLDAARNPTVWAKAKSQVAAVGGGVGLPLLHELLTKLISKRLGLDE